MSRFRQRKLNVKTALQILREDELEALVDDAFHSARANEPLSSLPKVESGVESKEEKEHHLQAVINATQSNNAGGKIDQIYIPTPDAVPAEGVDYDKLYPRVFAQPATYIRFSSTVEDCTGCPYCMTAEDETFLKTLNDTAAQQAQLQGKKRDNKGNLASPTQAAAQCSEDHFELVVNFFEDASASKQPFAAVDNTPVLEYAEMESVFDDSLDDTARHFASQIYEYWKQRRVERGNKQLMPTLKTLKLEGTQEADDSDPYICFRRREVRQARKTRGRDAQVAEKLRRLRKELEDARNIISYVRQREHSHRLALEQEKEVYQKRSALREIRRTLSLTGHEDDELLITQKTPKKKPEQIATALQAQNGRLPPGAMRSAQRGADGLMLHEMQLTMLQDRIDARNSEIARAIESQVEKHEQWNARFVDVTLEAALGLYVPPEDADRGNDFVTVKVGYGYDAEPRQQPTPPPSNPSHSPPPHHRSHDAHHEDQNLSTMDVDDSDDDLPHRAPEIPTSWDAPPSPSSYEDWPRYRRRIGRGGRVMLDRHNFKLQQSHPVRGGARSVADARKADQFRYDHDDGDVVPDKAVDVFSSTGFRYRSFWAMGRDQQQAQNAQIASSKEAQRRQVAAGMVLQVQQQQQQQQLRDAGANANAKPAAPATAS